MKFIECSHPNVEGTAMFAEASLPHQKKKGWVPVKAKSTYKPELVEPVSTYKPELVEPVESIEVPIEEYKSEPKPKVKKAESHDE